MKYHIIYSITDSHTGLTKRKEIDIDANSATSARTLVTKSEAKSKNDVVACRFISIEEKDEQL